MHKNTWKILTVVAFALLLVGATQNIHKVYDFFSGIKTDTIDEHTTATGVTIDSVLIKDGLVDGKDVSTLGSGNVDTFGTPVANDFAKFTDLDTIEGRTYAETKTDLSLNLVENTALSTWAGTANILTLGVVTTGTWNADVIDISTYTNLAGGTSITLAGDTLNVDDDFVKNTGGDSMAPKLTISDSASIAPLNITERATPPSAPASNDVYMDDGSNTASGLAGLRRYTGAVWQDLMSGTGTDPDAIHDNVAGEINALTTVTGVSGDMIIIEDATDSFNKKKVNLLDLLAGSGDVIGPASATDSNLTAFDTGTGKLIKDSGIALADVVQDTRQVADGEGIQGGGDLSADRTIALDLNSLSVEVTPTTGDKLVIWDGVNHLKIDWSDLPGAGGGEANTASNAGSGTSIFYQKTGVDLEFNAIKSENNRIAVALDGATHDVELTLTEANIDLDNCDNTTSLFITTRTGVYRTQDMDAGAMVPRTTNGATTATTESTTNKVMNDVFDFDASTDEFVQVKWAMPDVWDLGTVKVKLYWTSASGSGNVIWGVQAVALGNDDAIDTAFGTAQTVTDTLITADDVHVTSATASITVSGTPALGDIVYFQIYRDADAGGDTLAVDARLLKVVIQYKESATEPSAW